MNKRGRYVITGGPGVGKTTLLEIFSRMGYPIISEVARQVIERESKKYPSPFDWHTIPGFQDMIAAEQLKAEDAIEVPIVFLDRGLIDGYAYCRLRNTEIPKIIEDYAIDRYNKIFILDPLPTYINDSVRIEDFETAQRIHQKIEEAYRYFNYDPISVPVMTSSQNRAEYILERVLS